MVDMLADALRGRVACLFFPVTLTAGHAVTGGEDGVLHVPKKELVGTLQVLLQTRRLQVARSLTDAAVLVQELENFRAKVTAAKKETLESWREGRHDDLILAVAMAAWLGEQALTAPGEGPDESVACGQKGRWSRAGRSRRRSRGVWAERTADGRGATCRRWPWRNRAA